MKRNQALHRKITSKTDLNCNKRFLKAETDGAETICSDKEFQILMTRFAEK